ncbi:MAG: hypothetical protein EXQ56_02725 [Acidobacteria bacterium]|nr:hypothetical protein [Acidobacteriota bacterium]
MERDHIVIVALHTPKEKIWGRVLTLTPAGVTVQGIDLNAFDDWLRQVMESQPVVLPLTTAFYPMHRVERIVMDEAAGDIPSVAEKFALRVGLSLLEYLSMPR